MFNLNSGIFSSEKFEIDKTFSSIDVVDYLNPDCSYSSPIDVSYCFPKKSRKLEISEDEYGMSDSDSDVENSSVDEEEEEGDDVNTDIEESEPTECSKSEYLDAYVSDIDLETEENASEQNNKYRLGDIESDDDESDDSNSGSDETPPKSKSKANIIIKLHVHYDRPFYYEVGIVFSVLISIYMGKYLLSTHNDAQ